MDELLNWVFLIYPIKKQEYIAWYKYMPATCIISFSLLAVEFCAKWINAIMSYWAVGSIVLFISHEGNLSDAWF